MNINYEKCKKIISLLDSYFQDEGSIAEVEYPSSVVYGSNDYFLYMLNRVRFGRNAQVLEQIKPQIIDLRDTFRKAQEAKSI